MLLSISDLPNDTPLLKIVLANRINFQSKNIVGCPTGDKLNHQELISDCWKLIKACLVYDGIGIAGCQIGINKNLFIIRENEESFRIYFHPTYKADISQTLEVITEGCLSVPKMNFQVKRYPVIEASWFEFDPTQNIFLQKNEVLGGFQAEAFQHEMDHLLGINIIDIAIDLNRKQKRELLKNLSK